ncbi:hypothetical protein [Streptomyces sp. NPDC002952]|uniref:hypothetical protein n=1 Tax=Streptomyces sp. NPDC002952 TaxID=3364673 RepID=UPI0036B2B739
MNHIQKAAASALVAGALSLSMTMFSASAAQASTGWYDIEVQFKYLTLSDVHDCDFLEVSGCDNVETYGDFSLVNEDIPDWHNYEPWTPDSAYRDFLSSANWKRSGTAGTTYPNCDYWDQCYLLGVYAGEYNVASDLVSRSTANVPYGLCHSDDRDQCTNFDAVTKGSASSIKMRAQIGNHFSIGADWWDHDGMWGDDAACVTKVDKILDTTLANTPLSAGYFNGSAGAAKCKVSYLMRVTQVS